MTDSDSDLNFAADLWRTADALRGQLLRGDKRWEYREPPVGNVYYAWIQHFIHHLAYPKGKGGEVAKFVVANGSLSSKPSGEGDIRRAIVEADIVALPAQLFIHTGIPVCLWFLTRNKSGKNIHKGTPNRHKSRKSETLLINACKRGTMIDRVHRELTDAHIRTIAGIYHSWRNDNETTAYAANPVSARARPLRTYGHKLTLSRYVRAAGIEAGGESFVENMAA